MKSTRIKFFHTLYYSNCDIYLNSPAQEFTKVIKNYSN